ncbi:hypothetical protein Patl1_01506 [Pistacia atlantica]|uniref:Uncharacterized protein n=1 Tax=Pistacia atlantica TaxID=434234 RepID=A0ACC1C9W2_9ROSI|nr:hypothetical protein Patl1_01506 [Pistacia atlantica]
MFLRHSLIIPKSHFPSLEATPPSVIAAMCSKVPIISNAIMKTTASDSFNLLVNNGVAAGQVIFHTHIHIIPRKARDCLWASESLRRHPLKLDQETSRLADQVRKQLSNISEDTKGERGTGGYRVGQGSSSWLRNCHVFDLIFVIFVKVGEDGGDAGGGEVVVVVEAGEVVVEAGEGVVVVAVVKGGGDSWEKVYESAR